jgi:hypothetical protein
MPFITGPYLLPGVLSGSPPGHYVIWLKGSSALCPLPGSNYAITIPPGVRLGPNDNIRPFVTSAVATPPAALAPEPQQPQVIVVVPQAVYQEDLSLDLSFIFPIGQRRR